MLLPETMEFPLLGIISKVDRWFVGLGRIILERSH
jgi:hypothetical protein